MRLGTHSLRGVVCTDHEFRVPLDHSTPDGPGITVFAREVVASGSEGKELPWLLWLNGGPGSKAPRPTSTGGWLGRALTEFRVLLLDQRGTGRSHPLNRTTLQVVGDPGAQADHLRHFRADSIVRDAELIRRELLGEQGRWSVLGQSFGGFCLTTYLSLAPEGLAAAYFTGGLPSLDRSAADIYRLTYRRTAEKNAEFFARFPGDRDRVNAIVEHLRHHDVRLPTGERLTPRRFLTVGIQLGTRSGFDPLHYLLDESFVDGLDGPVLGDTFLGGVQQIVSFAARPLYAALHESIYCQGGRSAWAAERVRTEFAEFDPDVPEPLFTGEMMYPFMFNEDPSLVPLRAAADLLAERDGWPGLYDERRLADNDVPCAAAVYYDDMFVPREYSLDTARAIRGLRTWITNEYEHDGVKESGAVFDRLLTMAGRR